MLLFEAGSGGLSVLATDRLVKTIRGNVLDRAAELFEVTAAGINAVEAVPTQPGEIGVWTRTGGMRLRTRDFRRVSRRLPDSTSARLPKRCPSWSGLMSMG